MNTMDNTLDNQLFVLLLGVGHDSSLLALCLFQNHVELSPFCVWVVGDFNV